jgi:ribose transport system substrate-binding protein
MHIHRLFVAPAVIALVVGLAACGANSGPSGDASAGPASGGQQVALVTRGPNGESATPASTISLSAEDLAKIKQGNYTAALLWPSSGDFIDAVNRGVKAEFDTMGISVVATADSRFDPAQQQNDVATATAKKPSVIISLPIDPATAAAVYRPALEAGSKLVFMSNVPAGFVQGKDYVSIATDDLAQMGQKAADLLAASIGGSGPIGYVYHDAAFYVTNQRDTAFKTAIEQNYPGIRIAASAGIADPSKAEEVANAMLTKHPDLKGVYVTWSQPAEGVLSALRNAGNTSTKLVTLDLSEPIALDMLADKNVVGIVADEAYVLGQTLARLAGYGLLGRTAPPFVVAPAVGITKQNVAAGWMQSLHVAAPPQVLKAAG